MLLDDLGVDGGVHGCLFLWYLIDQRSSHRALSLALTSADGTACTVPSRNAARRAVSSCCQASATVGSSLFGRSESLARGLQTGKLTSSSGVRSTRSCMVANPFTVRTSDAHFDELSTRTRRRNRQAAFLQTIDMKSNRLRNELHHFSTALANGDATREVRGRRLQSWSALVRSQQGTAFKLPQRFGSERQHQQTPRSRLCRAAGVAPWNGVGESEAWGRAQLNRMYSKSTGCRLIPIAGGAIQFANLPGSTTRPINEAT